MKGLLWSTIVICCIASVSFAQGNPEPFDLGVFFDMNGQVSEGYIGAQQLPPVRLYVLMLNLGLEISGYSLSVSISGPNSSGWIVTRGVPSGLDVDPQPDGYVVNIGFCTGEVGGAYMINTYDFYWYPATAPASDTLVCVGPSNYEGQGAFFPGEVAALTCDPPLYSGQVIGFAQSSSCRPEIPNGCAVINPSTPGCVIEAAQSSWAALKERF